jgi:preprotein translocase subunit SecE
MDWVTIVLAVLLLAAMAALAVWRERVKVLARDTAAFVTEVQGEIKKVTWPDREQLKNATLVIIGFVLLMAVVIGVMDIMLQWIFVSALPKVLG